MTKKILIANTNLSDIVFLKDLFYLLKENEYELFFYSRNSNLKKYCQEQKFILIKSNRLFSLNQGIFQLLFILLIIPFLLYGFVLLSYFKLKHKIDILICFNWQEKIIFSLWAKIFGQKIIWIETPGPNKIKLNIVLRTFILLFHSIATTITFNQKTKNKLIKSKYKQENIKQIQPGINLAQALRQENIFSDLAKTKNINNKNNFYTIGTIVNLNKDQEIELIFGAIKKALNVIPNLQFIIIGEGQERKNLTWLAKKMEIGNLVWFVGEQAHLHKWLNSFNIFITSAKDASFTDIQALLHAMSSGIPVIAPINHGFDDIITDNINGLILEKNDTDELYSAIIKINQDKILANKLSQNAKKTVNEKNTDKIMTEKFINLL